MANNDNYRVLSDRDTAREKLPTFYGSRDNYYHGFRELMANARDELMKHFTKGEIAVTISGDKTITVTDSGRGMDLMSKVNGEPLYQVIFETLFAGGKMDDNKGLTGTNGVGLTVLNYTSSRFVVKSSVKGSIKASRVVYSDGGQNRYAETIPADKGSHFTSVEFKLDPEVYPETRFDPEKILFIIRHIMAVSPGIKTNFKTDSSPIMQIEYKNLASFFKEETRLTMPMVGGDDRIGETSYTAFFGTELEPVTNVFLNGTHLIEKSVVDTGFITGLRLEINLQNKDKRGFKPFSMKDIEESFSYAIQLESDTPEFVGQTKFSTKKKDYEVQSKALARELVKSVAEGSPTIWSKMMKHLKEVQKSNSNDDAAKEKLKKKLSESVEGLANRVEKLVDSEVHGKESELFITEGDSANGSIVQARDAHFQASYPVRGKVLNVVKASHAEIAKSQVITDLIRTIGTGIGDDFKLEDMRYGKIILAHDADSDGKQIAALLLNVIHKFMPQLLEEGLVYDAKTPLYMVRHKSTDDTSYLYDEQEYAKFMTQKQDDVLSVARLKGLGEIDADVMAEIALDPKSRNLTQIKVDSNFDSMIQDWLGNDVTPRKRMVDSRLADYLETATD